MKKCTKCGIEQSKENFYRDTKRYDRLRPMCKNCTKLITRQWRQNNKQKHSLQSLKWYYANPEKSKIINKKNYTKIQEKRRDYIIKVKTDFGGCPCGEKRLSCLVFHHIDKDNKDIEISKLRTMQSVKKEIEKCTILCGNCHLLYHAGELALDNIKKIVA
jgi:transcription elongation factor Elf1